VFSKEAHLGAVAGGILHYLAMELDSPIDVRMYHDVALIRYRAQIEIEEQGQGYPRAPYWFTDAYEKRDGQWQIMWDGDGQAWTARWSVGHNPVGVPGSVQSAPIHETPNSCSKA
jgi:Domain of unknown function (DUF4440)